LPQTLIDEDRVVRSRGALMTSARKQARGLAVTLCACLWIAVAPFGADAQPAPEEKSSLGAPKGVAKQATRPAAIPTPPRRPSNRPPTATAPSEPPAVSPEASRPVAPPLPPPAALPPVDLSVPPPTLPRASRQAMRRCALEWEKMKREGHVGAPMWREFATKCLTR
jgi:hypothetical protein